jgi:hypothetical protein
MREIVNGIFYDMRAGARGGCSERSAAVEDNLPPARLVARLRMF